MAMTMVNYAMVLVVVLSATVEGFKPAVAAGTMGNWTVDNCIVVKMAAELGINPTKNETNKKEVDIPVHANATGDCKSINNQTIVLSWSEPEPGTEMVLQRNLTVLFARNDTSNPPVYGVKKLEGVYETRHFQKEVPIPDKNTTVNQTFVEYVSFSTFTLNSLEFQTPVNRSYLCLNVGVISMHAELHDSSEPATASGEIVNNATFTAKNVQFDAFRPDDIEKNVLQTPLDCDFRPSDVVPIVVGCALAGTVLIVLIAYLVGRRRNRARGYQSV
eukprot:TRINITY_DN22040_c0_g1_i1.p1 TRINITY_DN22040_c0_g1~~TRINITY_DN22040_c0_g1_i1.p1  ORF type:complete len:274 (-),score=60.01 TRINITY_DN22040_c0_g1_i1:581-1402(-)